MIYADANVIIRLVEGDVAARAPLEARLLPLRGVGRFILTSQLSRLQCRTKPLRAGDTPLLALYDSFSPADKATELRALLNLKTPDALHLAAAVLSGAKSFLTGDKALARCKVIPIEVL